MRTLNSANKAFISNFGDHNIDSQLIPQVTVSQASRHAGVCQKTVRRWISAGVLKAVKVGGRYRTTEEWLQQMVKAGFNRVEEKKGIKRDIDTQYEESIRRLRVKYGIGKNVPDKLR